MRIPIQIPSIHMIDKSMLYIMIVYISLFLLLSFGIYNILIAIFKIPKKNKNIFSIKKLIKNKTKNIYTDGYSNLTHKIAEILPLPKFIKDYLVEQLEIADIKTTPKLYIADTIDNNKILFFIAILLIPFNKVFSLFFIFMLIHRVIKDITWINEKIRIKQEKIEKELPKFLSFVIQSFKFQKNVLEAFIAYENIAGEYFKKNITITIADMTTGNYETALHRLDNRINSYNFSKVIRAIISVIHGDNSITYLENLHKEYIAKEIERLRTESERKPEKVAKYSTILFVCILVMIFTIIAIEFKNNWYILNGYIK